MCLECEPENDHDCCRFRMLFARKYALGTIPKIYARRVRRHYDTLYAVWMEHKGERVAACVEACCVTDAKAQFIGMHFIGDAAEAELNRMYALTDTRSDMDQ
jgi:hypothetical protein